MDPDLGHEDLFKITDLLKRYGFFKLFRFLYHLSLFFIQQLENPFRYNSSSDRDLRAKYFFVVFCPWI